METTTESRAAVIEAAPIEMKKIEATAIQPQPVTPQHQNPNIPEHLNQQQALQVLVDAARVAQTKGIFSLEDAELVSKAIRAFVPKGPSPILP